MNDLLQKTRPVLSELELQQIGELEKLAGGGVIVLRCLYPLDYGVSALQSLEECNRAGRALMKPPTHDLKGAPLFSDNGALPRFETWGQGNSLIVTVADPAAAEAIKTHVLRYVWEKGNDVY